MSTLIQVQKSVETRPGEAHGSRARNSSDMAFGLLSDISNVDDPKSSKHNKKLNKCTTAENSELRISPLPSSACPLSSIDDASLSGSYRCLHDDAKENLLKKTSDTGAIPETYGHDRSSSLKVEGASSLSGSSRCLNIEREGNIHKMHGNDTLLKTCDRGNFSPSVKAEVNPSLSGKHQLIKDHKICCKCNPEVKENIVLNDVDSMCFRCSQSISKSGGYKSLINCSHATQITKNNGECSQIFIPDTSGNRKKTLQGPSSKFSYGFTESGISSDVNAVVRCDANVHVTSTSSKEDFNDAKDFVPPMDNGREGVEPSRNWLNDIIHEKMGLLNRDYTDDTGREEAEHASYFQHIDHIETPINNLGDSYNLEETDTKMIGSSSNNRRHGQNTSSFPSKEVDVLFKSSRQHFEYDCKHFQYSKGQVLKPKRMFEHHKMINGNSHYGWQNIGMKQNHNVQLDTSGASEPSCLPKKDNIQGKVWPPVQTTPMNDRGGLQSKKHSISIHEANTTDRRFLHQSHSRNVKQAYTNIFGKSIPRFIDRRSSSRPNFGYNQRWPSNQPNNNLCRKKHWVCKENNSGNHRTMSSDHSVTSEVPFIVPLQENTQVERSGRRNFNKQSVNVEAINLDHSSFDISFSQGCLKSHRGYNSEHSQTLHDINSLSISRNLTNGVPYYHDGGLLVSSDMVRYYNPNEWISSQIWQPGVGKICAMPDYIGTFDDSDINKVSVMETCGFMGHNSHLTRCDMPYYSACRRSFLEDGEAAHSPFEAKNTFVHIDLLPIPEALDVAQRARLQSEMVWFSEGSPIAEFEKLLFSASPAIFPSTFCQLSEPSHQRQNCDFLLEDVWNWYEKPGNYGLQVEAENSQKSKVVETNERFYAYFVPFLSAVQLFGDSNLSCITGESAVSSAETVKLSSNTYANSAVLGQSSSLKDIKDCDLSASERNALSSNFAHSFPYNSDIIFEFFEKEPPQQRKPLHLKIKELVGTDISKSFAYGDSSKLKCMHLTDLHPASWFSIAWYPIYRIPDGRLRASFLTYHSFGQFDCIIKTNPMMESIPLSIFPAIGMLTLNTKEDCWLNQSKLIRSISEYGVSAMLNERLRTLEDVASFFSRGIINKSTRTTANRHPDYEFFLSRRQ